MISVGYAFHERCEGPVRTTLLLFIALVASGCSGSPDAEISRTVTLSGERLAEIRSAPYVKRYRAGSGPAARLGGLDDDPWPEGILFMSFGPYLPELGFARGTLLAAIDGKGVHDVFVDRWAEKRIRRPAGFHAEHYRDLMEYVFVENDPDGTILSVYRDVPLSASEVSSYEPAVEHWRLEVRD